MTNEFDLLFTGRRSRSSRETQNRKEPLQKLAHFTDHVGQLQNYGAQRLLAAEGEQLPREAGGAVGIGLDLLDVVVIAVAGRMAQQHEVAIADDRGQHVVEIVGNTAR